jgi:hypothetical protein
MGINLIICEIDEQLAKNIPLKKSKYLLERKIINLKKLEACKDLQMKA